MTQERFRQLAGSDFVTWCLKMKCKGQHTSCLLILFLGTFLQALSKDINEMGVLTLNLTRSWTCILGRNLSKAVRNSGRSKLRGRQSVPVGGRWLWGWAGDCLPALHLLLPCSVFKWWILIRWWPSPNSSETRQHTAALTQTRSTARRVGAEGRQIPELNNGFWSLQCKQQFKYSKQIKIIKLYIEIWYKGGC